MIPILRLASIPVFVWLFLLLNAALAAPPVPSALFSDGAVLQRDRELPVWGYASPGDRIVVEFGRRRATAIAADDGRWLATLPAFAASAEGRTLRISGPGGSVEAKDVLVGEVWLGSGQSNMQWTISQVRSEDQEAALAAGPIPRLRYFHVPREASLERRTSVDAAWQHTSPETVREFSAVAYFFGRNLVEELGVPVGMIHSSWGGAFIEPWWADEGLDGIDELAAVRAHRRARSPGFPEYERILSEHQAAERAWHDAAAAATDLGRPLPPRPEIEQLDVGHRSEAGTYQAMIHPLVPYALRGFLWYQGESNNGDGMDYFHKKRALIAGWRQAFRNPEAPFLYVQLAPYNYGEDRAHSLPEFWAAQQACLQIPHTGMAVTMDIGDVKDIHPGNKFEVGRRLALWALADTYGRSDLVKSGPLYAGVLALEDRLEVRFDYTGSGLITRDGSAPDFFEVAGADGIFHPADAEIGVGGDTVLLRSEAVPQPQRARFAWRQDAEPNLMNREGLPAAAFDTHWPSTAED